MGGGFEITQGSKPAKAGLGFVRHGLIGVSCLLSRFERFGVWGVWGFLFLF